MAKQILLNTLVNVFGEYIDGLNEENLKLGVSEKRRSTFLMVLIDSV